MQDTIQANLYHCSSQTKDLATADVQRVHHHDAVLIKENESDQRESNGNPKDQRNFTVQRNLN